ncbi:MAG: hypothetical protein AB7O66_00555 [Limisphaerales bacterium]
MTNPASTLGPVSWERMIRGVEKVRERLVRAARALELAGVPYAVVGGNAVAAHVSRVDESAVRTTRDVDVLLRPADLDAARRALENAGFIHRRIAGLGMPVGMDVFLDGPTATVRDALHVVRAGEKVRPDSVHPAPDVSESEPAGGFQLVTLAALVRMKLTSFRDRDRTHLRDFLELGLIDASWCESLPEPLDSRLKDLLDHPES